MTDASLPYMTDEEGNYVFLDKLTPAEVIELATHIIKCKFNKGAALTGPDATKNYLMLHLGHLEHEVFSCIFLDNRHRIISFDIMFYGTIDGASVHPREVVKRALKHNAAAVIFSHNHPSGVAEPSQADQSMTKRLKDALGLVNIRVLDHIIVGESEPVSFAERGML